MLDSLLELAALLGLWSLIQEQVEAEGTQMAMDLLGCPLRVSSIISCQSWKRKASDAKSKTITTVLVLLPANYASIPKVSRHLWPKRSYPEKFGELAVWKASLGLRWLSNDTLGNLFLEEETVTSSHQWSFRLCWWIVISDFVGYVEERP